MNKCRLMKGARLLVGWFICWSLRTMVFGFGAYFAYLLAACVIGFPVDVYAEVLTVPMRLLLGWLSASAVAIVGVGSRQLWDAGEVVKEIVTSEGPE